MVQEIIIFMVNIKPASPQLLQTVDEFEPAYTLIIDFVKKFHDYPIVFHYGNQSENRRLVSNIGREFRTQYLWNHDLFYEYTRPAGTKFLHVVNLGDFDNLEEFFFSRKNIIPKDIAIFLTREEPFPKRILKTLSHSIGLFVVTRRDPKLSYCGYSYKKYVCSLKEIRIEDVDPKLISRDLLNFKGYTFRVGYLLSPPDTYIE
ncbi:hypothetical protein JTB14_000347 [Gonioctena quinquepunctata]|nr:hypothetical protein JTB14_000347 [Gonioctena quinquepunctata]